VAAVYLLICLALVPIGVPTAHAQALGATTGTGVLTGSVGNGTHNNAPVAGQRVTLQEYVSHATPQDITHTTTDAHGGFSFSGLDGSGATTYAVYASFQNGTFTSGPITLANGGALEQLTVYDTTTNDSAITVGLATVLFSEPNTQTGMIPVGEFLTFSNTGKTAYVATPGAENGKPTGLLRFGLPAGATNVSLGAGFEGAQSVTVDGGFATTGTLPPGKTQVAFAFQVPYSGSDYVFPYRAEYATAQVAVLIPLDMQIEAGDFTGQQPVTATGQQFHLLTKDRLAAGATASVRVWGLTVPGEQPSFSFRQLVGVGAGLALLLALLLVLFLRRGNLAIAFGLIPASADGPATKRTTSVRGGDSREAERKRLLKDLLALEKSHTAGTVPDVTYRRRREDLRGNLRAVLAESASTKQTGLGHEPTAANAGGDADSGQGSPARSATSVAPVPSGAPQTSEARQVSGGAR
jgi:hypothetical protein